MRSAALGEVPHELRAVGASSALLSERLPLVQSRSRKTTSFPIPLFTVGIRPLLSLSLISVLNISLRNFQGRCLLFSYQGSLLCCLSHLSDNFYIISCRFAFVNNFFQLFSSSFSKVFCEYQQTCAPAPLSRWPYPAKNPPSCVVDFYNIIILAYCQCFFSFF